MPRRLLLTLGTVLAVLVAGAGVGWVVWGDDLDYRHHLERYDDATGEPSRYVNVGDGRAQLAIGSPDRHRIVVQWRDPDGTGWTAPETVWEDEDNTFIEDTVRFGGGTAGILATYTPDTSKDSDIGDLTVGIVCRERSCTAKAEPGGAGEAQVTPDGGTVYLGQDEHAAYLWTAARGIHAEPWSGHPGFAYRRVSPSEPVLAPDGSLRVVTSRPSRGSCTFELLAGRPGTAALEPVGRQREPLRGKARSDCRSYLDTYSSDWVTVHSEDHRVPTFWFVQDGDAWTTTTTDPSGLELVDVGRRCCETLVIGFVHWNDVAFGSPDGRRIQVQTHLLGDETWSRVQVLAGAPAGARCTYIDGHSLGDGFAVLLQCGRAYAVAATPDLRHWESTYVTGVRDEPQVDGDTLRLGGTTWTPDGGFSS